MKILSNTPLTLARPTSPRHTPTTMAPRDYVERSEASPANYDRIALHAGLGAGLGAFAGLARGLGAGMAGAAIGVPGGILLGGLVGGIAGEKLFGTSGAETAGAAIWGAVAGGLLGGAGCYLLASSVSSPVLAVGLAAVGAAEGLLLFR